MDTVLVTGGAGFIGGNFVREWISSVGGKVVNLDRLTYAGNLASLADLQDDPRHVFEHGDICDTARVAALLEHHQPDAVVHFAAESHVDRSISGPGVFVDTNVRGTWVMLDAFRAYWHAQPDERKHRLRFLHVSTDEVYGSLEPHGAPVAEGAAYQPNSPYAASKAAADHLVRAYHRTYGLPTLTTNCSNNYGPYQFPEKLIPLTLVNARAGKPLPIYGDGSNVRDWLHVGDHCSALRAVLARGVPGEVYHIGGEAERTNLELVHVLCGLLDALAPAVRPYAQQITFVTDRPGHDRRYAIDCGRAKRELGWAPRYTLEQGLRQTVQWYLEHQDWVESVASGAYREWMKIHYGLSA